ncbi:universal stress protein [Pedomonas mirosovicensis]|uniref:universal stress protein n=1 Tax=Pedomonas mirosovicensis TaxID=2908641 RepID=UPI00216746EE|nr:universal stress protein [Pedomonas mirosovicensis]MCH8684260.1 universal stress protein [Pedomonas mirosovicensis]
MLKDILVLLGETGAESPALEFAVELARANSAHLTAVVCAGVPLYQEYLLGTVVFEAYQTEVGRQTEVAEAACAAVRERLGASGVPHEVRTIIVDLDILPMDAAVHARYADLVLVGHRGSYGDGRMWDRLVQSIVFQTGRPLIIVPERAHLPLDKVMIGWNASREAVRAVHDAMDLISAAERVDVAVVDAVPSDDGHGEEPGAGLAAHLARHVRNVDVHRLDSQGRPIGEVLQTFARDQGARLLVMGAYGHSRMWEMLLGGATRDVLANATMPVLLSH